MAAPNTTSTTLTTITSPANQSFRFMDLPAELRIKVYEIALQDYVDEILLLADMRPCPKYHGALGLLQTSKTQRIESVHAMLPLVAAEYHRREADFNRAERQGAGYSYRPWGPESAQFTSARWEAYHAYVVGHAIYDLKWQLQWALLIDSPSRLHDQHWELLGRCSIRR